MQKNKDLIDITSKFGDVNKLIIERKKLANDASRIRRKLKTQYEKYSFLMEMVGVNSASTPLVNSIVKCFKELGFDDVHNVDKITGQEDIRLYVEDKLIIFEVTGIDSDKPQYKKAHSISMHKPIREQQNPNKKVFAVFIVNHDNKKHFKNRNKKPFEKGIIEIAEASKYGLITTIELFYAFVAVKMGKLSREEILNKICTNGEIKIEVAKSPEE